MDQEIKVSISCLAYNHEKYIRRCLEGFVKQNTNFKYEVLIHDDASTDRTGEIIKEYEEKYPEIIKPIYQNENKYSKGVSITKEIQLPRAKGKYLAICEGDDYWCDENKLQKQFDYMEGHEKCTLCVHEAIKYDLYSNKKENYTKINEECNVPVEKILEEGAMFATNSCFVRTEIHKKMPELFEAKGFGDHQLIIYNTLQGYCHYFKEVMSVYNWGTEGSWTENVFRDKNKRVAQCKEMISLMKRIDAYTNFQYSDAIKQKILKTEFNMFLVNGNFLKIQQRKYKRIWKNGGWNPTKECIVNRFPFLKKRI